VILARDSGIFAFPAVASDGTVYVLWHDYNAEEIYISKSTDGGVTWANWPYLFS